MLTAKDLTQGQNDGERHIVPESPPGISAHYRKLAVYPQLAIPAIANPLVNC
jgi:hypothetical protein